MSTKEDFQKLTLLLEERSKGYLVILEKYQEQTKKVQATMKEQFTIETERIKSEYQNRIDDLDYDLKSLQKKYDALTKSLEVSAEMNKCKDKKIAFQERTISTLRANNSNLEENLKFSSIRKGLTWGWRVDITSCDQNREEDRWRRRFEKRDISSKMDMETGVLRKNCKRARTLRNKTRNLVATSWEWMVRWTNLQWMSFSGSMERPPRYGSHCQGLYETLPVSVSLEDENITLSIDNYITRSQARKCIWQIREENEWVLTLFKRARHTCEKKQVKQGFASRGTFFGYSESRKYRVDCNVIFFFSLFDS